MRICLISREYPPDTGWGGIGAYTYQHAKALKKLGHEVDVIALTKEDAREDSPIIDDEGVRVHRCAWGYKMKSLGAFWISLSLSHFSVKSSLSLWSKLAELHAQQPFDVVEAPEHLAESLFLSMTKLCPLVLRLHTPLSKFIGERYHNLSPSFDEELISVLERQTILNADLLSSPSRDLASYIARDCGVDLNEIEDVPNAIDTNKFTPEGSRAITVPDKVLVFFAGRLEERKGIHYLIEAIPKVIKELPQARFIVVGADTNTGPGKSSVLETLKASLSAAGALDAVQFVSHVPLAEMPAHYRSADICVVPSLYDNAPYTVLEAMGCGKPIVATNAGGTPEYVRNEETGLVVESRDANGLAQAIARLVKNKDEREKFGHRAHQIALSQYDRDVVAKQAVTTYEKAIARHHRRGLYRRPAAQCVEDTVRFLHAYQQNLSNFLYTHSVAFRIKYWMKQCTSRPKLTAARFIVACMDAVPGVKSFEAKKENLKQRVALSRQTVNELEIQSLIRQFGKLETVVSEPAPSVVQ